MAFVEMLKFFNLLSWQNKLCSSKAYLGAREAIHLEYLQLSHAIIDLLTSAVYKVPGFYFKGLTALANKPPNMQIFASSKFGINRSTDLKVMAKKF